MYALRRFSTLLKDERFIQGAYVAEKNSVGFLLSFQATSVKVLRGT